MSCETSRAAAAPPSLPLSLGRSRGRAPGVTRKLALPFRCNGSLKIRVNFTQLPFTLLHRICVKSTAGKGRKCKTAKLQIIWKHPTPRQHIQIIIIHIFMFLVSCEEHFYRNWTFHWVSEGWRERVRSIITDHICPSVDAQISNIFRIKLLMSGGGGQLESIWLLPPVIAKLATVVFPHLWLPSFVVHTQSTLHWLHTVWYALCIVGTTPDTHHILTKDTILGFCITEVMWLYTDTWQCITLCRAMIRLHSDCTS